MSEAIVVQDREELIFLLCEAAEFEHTVMATYLYAAWSLKREADDSCTETELEAVNRWRGALRRVALEEMLHLTLVNNLLASLGAAPNLGRPAFPVPPGRFPADVVFTLRGFNEASMAHFTYIERPEGIEMADGEGFHHHANYHRVARPDLLMPRPQDYESQGHLYHAIGQALTDLVARDGEDGVFVGHGESQVGGAEFRLPGLFKVTDLKTALEALEEIVEQGEGAPAHSEDSHYAVFDEVRREYHAMKAARPAFEPAFDCVTDPVLDNPLGREGVTPIQDPDTQRVVDLGDALYALMMRTFAQVFAPSPLPRPLRSGLANVATEVMYALSAIGAHAASLPSGIVEGENAGKTAGLTLTLPGSNGQLVQSCAAQILAERAAEIGATARKLEAELGIPAVADRLDGLVTRLNTLHERYEEHISLSVDKLVSHATDEAQDTGTLQDSEDPNVAITEDVTLRFDTKRCIHSRHCVLSAPRVFLANVEGAWLHPETASVEAIAHVAHSCPSGAITYERRDGVANEQPPEVNVLRIRENGPYGVRANVELEGHGRVLRATLCRCGKSKNKPFCDNSHHAARFVASGEPKTRPSGALTERGGQLLIEPLKDGPLQVTGSVEICAGTGRTVDRVQNCRLCRCGGSASKPFCDGTHARNGFTSD